MSARAEPNNSGQMTEEIFWGDSPSLVGIIADKYVTMPNHLHCIMISRERAEIREQPDTRSAPTEMETIADVQRPNGYGRYRSLV